MKMTGKLKKIICIAAVIFLITSVAYAYPSGPIYKDGIVWTYGENMKIDYILHEIEGILDYVVVHELCHLVHINHSTDFWNLVVSMFSYYNEKKNWLRKNAPVIEF